jgi:hypothetical protein
MRMLVDFFMVWFLGDWFVCGFRPRESRGTFGWVIVAQSRTACVRWSVSNYRTL